MKVAVGLVPWCPYRLTVLCVLIDDPVTSTEATSPSPVPRSGLALGPPWDKLHRKCPWDQQLAGDY